MPLQTCSNTTEAIALEPSLGLYLKPVSKIKINVQLPKLSEPGQSISSWHVMEKLKATVRPDTFIFLKSLKIASNVIKFEGELETKASCERALARLRAAGSLKLSGFTERLQIRAAHAPCSGPTRHDWEAFFRDAKGVNEMKPGERPDTIHVEELPVRWFAESSKSVKPSEKLLQKAFGTFGKIRRLEVPRNTDEENNTFGKTSSLHSDLLFEVFIQYEEYVEFSIAMDSLRGKKLLYKEPDGKVYSADIKVDFDRINYLSDKCIKSREAEEKKMTILYPPLPDKTKSSKDDNNRNPKVSKPPVLPEKSLAPEKKTKPEKIIPDMSLTKKVKAIILSTDEQEKAQKEAKQLIKELLQRAEKHKRRTEEEATTSSVKCVPQDLQKGIKQPKKSPKIKGKDSETYTDGKDKVTFSFQKGDKMEQTSSNRVQEELQGVNQLHELQRNIAVQQPEITLGKETHKVEEKFDTLNFQKFSMKRKLTSELYEKKKETQLYEVKKEKRLLDEKESNNKRNKKHIETDTDGKCKEKQASLMCNEESKSGEKHTFARGKDKEKYVNLRIEEKKIKDSLIKSHDEERKNKEKLRLQERILKEKLLRNLKAREEEKLRNREKLRKELAGRKVLKSVLADTKLHKNS